MKKAVTIALIVGCAACVGLVVPFQGIGYAGGKTFDLTFTTAYFDKHPTVRNAFIPWMKQLKEMSGGKLNLEYYNPNTLGPDKDNYDSTVDGIVDIGSQYNGRNPGKFPIAEVMELPLIVPCAEAGSLTTWDLYEKYPEWRAEYPNVKILWQWTSATYQLHTTKKMVKTSDDLKGMKIICWSPKLMEIMKALGASPIQVAPPDTYLALQRGMAEGVLCPLAPVKSFKISDAAKYHTIVDLCVGPFWAAANLQVWESLPADLQKMLVDTTGMKMASASGKTLDEGAAEDSQWLKEHGHEFYVLPEAEKASWLDKLQYMRADWVKKMKANGVANAQDILDDAVRLGAEYAKTTGRGYK